MGENGPGARTKTSITSSVAQESRHERSAGDNTGDQDLAGGKNADVIHHILVVRRPREPHEAVVAKALIDLSVRPQPKNGRGWMVRIGSIGGRDQNPAIWLHRQRGRCAALKWKHRAPPVPEAAVERTGCSQLVDHLRPTPMGAVTRLWAGTTRAIARYENAAIRQRCDRATDAPLLAKGPKGWIRRPVPQISLDDPDL
jgi:hypothetical protein